MRDAERDTFYLGVCSLTLTTYSLTTLPYPNPNPNPILTLTIHSLTTPYGCSYSSGGSQLSSSELSALEPIGT